jgi:hypothetical protein
MKMEFSKAIPIGEKTNISLPSNIESLPCGLFRCGLKDAFIKLPELSCLYKTSPVEISNDWQIDIKIHMLMRGQYPCIPNWHCDNVIRDKDGALDFKKTSLEQSPYKMYIWLSNNPTTLFLREKLKLNFTPSSHRDIAKFLAHDDGNPAYPIESQQWYEFDQLTPHCRRS